MNQQGAIYDTIENFKNVKDLCGAIKWQVNEKAQRLCV